MNDVNRYSPEHNAGALVAHPEEPTFFLTVPTVAQLAARVRWVELLREGKYRPLKQALSTVSGKSRCCLGVACDPVVHGLDLEVRTCEDSGRKRLAWDGYATVLPGRVMQALGFNIANPRVLTSEYSHLPTLASLNDRGVPHRVLADHIERTYITPFQSQEA